MAEREYGRSLPTEAPAAAVGSTGSLPAAVRASPPVSAVHAPTTSGTTVVEPGHDLQGAFDDAFDESSAAFGWSGWR